MAYGVKYRFQLESYNKTVYRVDLLEDGYSGTITTRPLGKAPVLRMQDAAPFRSTSCDLALECQSDGEYIDLYTTDPFHFKVEVYRIDDNDGAWIIWRGYVPTEIYSEPDIAPPYDVRITATDGIGLLKEYTFEAVGAKSIRAHICDLLEKTGDSAPMYYYATRLCKLGSTEVAFMDDALIDLDYLAGENCYDVLKAILVSLRSVLIYRGSHWLIVREVDVQMSSDGMLTAVQCITSDPYYVPSSTTVKEGKSVGQMGVADMWPVGYLTRRVVPAKKGVRVRAPWHYVNGYPEVSANGWTVSDNASFDSTNKLYHIGTRSQSVATAKGAVQSSKTLQRFVDNFKVVIKANAHSVYGNDTAIAHYVRVNAAWRSTAGGSITTYYWDSEYGWTTNDSYSVEEIGVEGTNEGHDPNACRIVEVSFPPVPDNNPGYLTIKVDGSLVDIYGIEVLPATVAGYEDNILIDNGARGEAESIDVFGGRLMLSNFINLDFYQGIFFHTDGQSSGPDTQFSDLMNIGKDFMSLAALAYAREVAAPRIEISGKLNHEYDTALGMPAPFIKSHGVWALMKSYDWDMMTEDVSFTAVTLPSVLLDVEDEVINSIAPEGGIFGGSSSGSGGGGGGGGSYVLPIASASTLGGVKVGSGLAIDANGVLSAGGGKKIYELSDNGTATAGTWLAQNSDIAAYEDGMIVAYKLTVAGANPTKLNVNGLGAKTVYRYGSTKLTTQYAVGSILLLVYNSSLNSGCWVVMNDYDANSYAYLRQYQTLASDNVEYPVLHKYDSVAPGTAGSYVTKYSKYTDDVTVNPSTGVLSAKGFKVSGTVGFLKSDGTVDTTQVPLQAPVIEIQRGWLTNAQNPIDDRIKATHPGIGVLPNAEFVLMVMAKRRGRKTGNLTSWSRGGWGCAQGIIGQGKITFSGTVLLNTIRLFIVQNYLCAQGTASNLGSYTLAQFKALSVDVGFGHADIALTVQDFLNKTRRSRLFGIALRYENPAFTELVSGTLSDHTTAIPDGNTVVPRWIYSDVAPFRVHVHKAWLSNAAATTGNVLGFELLE